MTVKKSRFRIEEDEIYEGYTNGSTWNGWECPYFTLEVGKKICEDYSDDEHRLYYDEIEDCFMEFDMEEGEFKHIGSRCRIAVDGKLMNLYDIGAMSWVWYEVWVG